MRLATSLEQRYPPLVRAMSDYLRQSEKKQMCCFDQEQRHTTEQDLVMTAKQSTAEASHEHTATAWCRSHLVNVPTPAA